MQVNHSEPSNHIRILNNKPADNPLIEVDTYYRWVYWNLGNDYITLNDYIWN